MIAKNNVSFLSQGYEKYYVFVSFLSCLTFQTKGQQLFLKRKFAKKKTFYNLFQIYNLIRIMQLRRVGSLNVIEIKDFPKEKEEKKKF